MAIVVVVAVASRSITQVGASVASTATIGTTIALIITTTSTTSRVRISNRSRISSTTHYLLPIPRVGPARIPVVHCEGEFAYGIAFIIFRSLEM